MPSLVSPFEQFRVLMEADAGLQEKLNVPEDPAEFIVLVVDGARDHGIPLDTEAVAAMLDGWPDAVSRSPPAGWLPVRSRWHDQALWLDWAYVGSRRLREPFFEESIARCVNRPFNRLFRYATPISALEGWLRDHPPVPPAGLIFHQSRCGSTLASQMLAAMSRSVVISEAGPIDAVVQAPHARPDIEDAQHATWLRWIIGALGQPRSGEEQHCFVKLDSWHTLALPLFRHAFPGVPWIFLYRDPVEVLVSQLRQRGVHTVPGLLGPDVFGLGEPPATPVEYCARVLGRICDGALRAYRAGPGLLVNYRQLPSALWSEVLPHFGVTCSDDDRIAMAQAARHDAKRPEQLFISDTNAKRGAATDAIRAAAQTLDPLHARLEALRCARESMAAPAANIIEINSPLGMLRLRPEREADQAFRFALFCQSRPAELALLPLEPVAFEQLMRLQFKAQAVSYRSGFPNARFDIIEHDGLPVGRIVVDRSGSALRIVDQAIVPARRGRGFGTAIMQALMDKASRTGLPLRLNVASSNDAAMRLYLRLGLVPIHVEPLSIEMEWRAPATATDP
jgi:GNAT superfamily N-acetyltransferase